MNEQRVAALERMTTLEYILLGDLREMLEEPIEDGTDRRWLTAVLDALLETLPLEVELIEEDGYLLEVIHRFPNWSPQVDRLKRDHDELYFKLKELRGRLDKDAWISPIADEVRDGLRRWMLAFTAHHRSETRLVHRAINLDVGAGD
jgi:hypothetical protein